MHTCMCARCVRAHAHASVRAHVHARVQTCDLAHGMSAYTCACALEHACASMREQTCACAEACRCTGVFVWVFSSVRVWPPDSAVWSPSCAKSMVKDETAGYSGATSVGGLRCLRVGCVGRFGGWGCSSPTRRSPPSPSMREPGTQSGRGAPRGDQGDRSRRADSSGHKRRRRWGPMFATLPAKSRGITTLPAGRRQLHHHGRRRVQRSVRRPGVVLRVLSGGSIYRAGSRPMWSAPTAKCVWNT